MTSASFPRCWQPQGSSGRTTPAPRSQCQQNRRRARPFAVRLRRVRRRPGTDAPPGRLRRSMCRDAVDAVSARFQENAPRPARRAGICARARHTPRARLRHRRGRAPCAPHRAKRALDTRARERRTQGTIAPPASDVRIRPPSAVSLLAGIVRSRQSSTRLSRSRAPRSTPASSTSRTRPRNTPFSRRISAVSVVDAMGRNGS